MRKKYKYLIFLVVVIVGLLICLFLVKGRDNIKKIDNNGFTLSERFANLYNVVDSGNGLYKINDKYIFRGNSNNYIKFNNELWRIVSLENDGSIKIVRNDLLSDCLDLKEALEFLNGSYYDYLENKDLVVRHDFDITYYDIGKLTSEEDLNKLVVDDRKSYYVGLLSVNEIANATAYISFDSYLNTFFWVNRRANYLYLAEEWLTMTPSVYVNFDFLKEESNIKAKIRPTLYLRSDLKIYHGIGSKNDPYILEVK